ncbi:MAG TPA: polysaccharide lyase 6 family protein, partial [Prosthecobacter sp.]|nr:polysaccharide lyase 6 family protein [Prosthecobacter sp.]
MRLIAFLLCLPLAAAANDFPVADIKAFDAAVKAAQPGDTIVLSEGRWTDLVLKFKGAGTKDAPITLKAAVPGRTEITGRSQLKIGGEYLVVEGLHIHNPDPEAGDPVEFRIDSKMLARNCRLTHCAITQDAEVKPVKESRWVGIYGGHNRIDHCLMQGKTNKGTTLVVWLGEGQEAAHTIENNYFGPREKLGKNGGETIRIGDSQTSMRTAGCVIQRNLFETCNGEAECISNKSCGNLYRE